MLQEQLYPIYSDDVLTQPEHVVWNISQALAHGITSNHRCYIVQPNNVVLVCQDGQIERSFSISHNEYPLNYRSLLLAMLEHPQGDHWLDNRKQNWIRNTIQ